jgi:hypothetical protein
MFEDIFLVVLGVVVILMILWDVWDAVRIVNDVSG